MKTLLPYGKTEIPVDIDGQNHAGSLVSRVDSYEPGKSPEELVEASLDYRIGSPKLEELAKGKNNIVFISSDHTRHGPSKVIAPCPIGAHSFSTARVWPFQLALNLFSTRSW